MSEELRFLLDQGFPQPKLAVKELEANVSFQHLQDYAPDLSNHSTPDWMVYLAADAGGFDGVVTQDFRQVAQQEELVVLTRLDLSVITWREGIEDPVTAWATLVAYTPSLVKAIDIHKHSIFFLPLPRLIPKDHVLKASNRARELAKLEWKMSYPEATSESLTLMRDELQHRGRMDLAPPLERKAKPPEVLKQVMVQEGTETAPVDEPPQGPASLFEQDET